MDLGSNIKNNRIRSNLKQEDLAKYCNVTRSAVSNWESGKRKPDFENIIKLSHLFDVTVEQLVGSDYVKVIPKHIIVTPKLTKSLLFSYTAPIIYTVVVLIIMLSVLSTLVIDYNRTSNNNPIQNAENIQSIYCVATDNTIDFNVPLYKETSTKYYNNNVVVSEKYFKKNHNHTQMIFIFRTTIYYVDKTIVEINKNYHFDLYDDKTIISSRNDFTYLYIFTPGTYSFELEIKDSKYYFTATMLN